jgi:hypothetical protein
MGGCAQMKSVSIDCRSENIRIEAIAVPELKLGNA